MTTIHELRKLLEAATLADELVHQAIHAKGTFKDTGYYDACSGRSAAYDELDKALRNAAPALLALADAAEEVDRCGNHHELIGPLGRLSAALSALAPTNTKEES